MKNSVQNRVLFYSKAKCLEVSPLFPSSSLSWFRPKTDYQPVQNDPVIPQRLLDRMPCLAAVVKVHLKESPKKIDWNCPIHGSFEENEEGVNKENESHINMEVDPQENELTYSQVQIDLTCKIDLLNDEDEAMAQEISPIEVDKKKCDSIKVGEAGRDQVNVHDLKCLVKVDGWLNDSIINCFASILLDEYHNSNNNNNISQSPKQKIDLLPSYAVMKKGGRLSDQKGCFRRLSNDADKVFMVLNINRIHWVLIVVEGIKKTERTIKIYDSKKRCVTQNTIDDHLELLKKNFDQKYQKSCWLDLIHMDTVQQNDGHSCGPSALYILERLLNFQDLGSYKPDDLKVYRTQILDRILRTTRVGREILQRSLKNESSIESILMDTKELVKISQRSEVKTGVTKK